MQNRISIILFFIIKIYTSSLVNAQVDSFQLIKLLTMEDGLMNNKVLTLDKREFSLMIIGYDYGLQIYNGTFFIDSKTNLPNILYQNRINSIAIRKDGSFWYGTDDGVLKFNPYLSTHEKFFNIGNKKFPSLNSDSTAISLLTRTPNEKIWIVSNGTLCQIEHDKVTPYFSDKFNTIRKIEGDHENNIFALTAESLIVFDSLGNLIFEKKEFETPLSRNQKMKSISNIFKTKEGEIILEDFSNEKFFEVNAEGHIKELNAENHWLPLLFKTLDSKLNHTKALRKFDILETEDGLYWVATNVGLAKLKCTSKAKKRGDEFVSQFVSLYQKFNSKTKRMNTFFRNPLLNKTIRLHPDESSLQLFFINNDYNTANEKYYSYYLEGFEKGWFPFTPIKSTSYSNLPAGEYLFKLKSKDELGTENKYIDHVHIVVENHFYKRWWFWILAMGGLLSLFGLFIHNNILRRTKNAQLRKRLASDLHDEVSNTLNNIRIIAKESNHAEKEVMTSGFERIQKISSEAIEHVEDVIWSIDKSHSTIGDLFLKMEDYVDDVLRAKNIPVKFAHTGLDENASIGFIIRRNLILIFKEAITNIIKHSEPTHVDILFQKNKKEYQMRIFNTFEKRIAAQLSTQRGLVSMQQRAEEMGATISFIEEKNSFEVLLEKK